jgi:hypothetical protein
MEILNSYLNIIANVVLFVGGLMFYHHYIEDVPKSVISAIMKVLTAMLVTGTFARVVFDLNIIISGINKNFDIIESAIALLRNFGLGGILIYLIVYREKK